MLNKIANIASLLIFNFVKLLFGKNRANYFVSILSNKLIPIISMKKDDNEINFFSPNDLVVWRANSIFYKESETIDWIDNFKQNDLLWDIGANVGVFSLYAASKKNRVISFEPSPGNYYILSKNIEINEFDNLISAYPIAINDISILDNFFMETTSLGSALSNFGSATNWKGEKMNFSYKQSTISYSIDDFIDTYNLEIPNHIKIDVDGNENKVLLGAKKTLKNENLKTILIELDTNKKGTYFETLNLLKNCRFKIKSIHESDFVNPEYLGVKNHIFIR